MLYDTMVHLRGSLSAMVLEEWQKCNTHSNLARIGSPFKNKIKTTRGWALHAFDLAICTRPTEILAFALSINKDSIKA